MKTLVTFLLLAICLPQVAFSSPVSVASGPFNISFDINTTKALIYQPQYSNTRTGPGGQAIIFNGLEIKDRNAPDDAAKAQISINEYSNPISNSLEYKAEQTAKLFHLVDGSASIEYRTIDSNPGYVVTGVNEAGRIEYSSGYRIGNQTEVTIVGALPELTDILNTIHIERRSEPVMNETLKV